ncbi:MAG TPA: methionyl-tRNA formyltransferase [Flavobacteriales bacterium]|nr:methionyl-tRNA formyltransferase [Flavobacteriales bacterium]|tara:strand:+ start:19838 stop:20803 length:966 start_codon:yes stop_codon:yes gene_type:complete
MYTKQDLRIIFMGTPDFAVPSLDILLKHNYNIVAVVTAPDKPAGRGRKLQQSAVKKYALEHNLPVLQPVNLKAPDFIEELKSYNANLQIVVAFRMLPEVVWNMPELGTFNLHASLLPKYRGAAPINWAIINGEKETGVTTFFLQHEIDTGEIIMQEKVQISETDTAGTLHDKLMLIGADVVLKTVQSIENGSVKTSPQDDKMACPAPKIFKKDCLIDWNNSNESLYNKIRGLSPYPTAFTYLKSKSGDRKVLKIYFTEKINDKPAKKPGTIITDNKSYIHVSTADGLLILTDLQLEGKKRLAIKDFLNGTDMEQFEQHLES